VFTGSEKVPLLLCDKKLNEKLNASVLVERKESYPLPPITEGNKFRM
jgi:hypothetical protein